MTQENNGNGKLTPEQREKLRKLQEDDRKNSKYIALGPNEELNVQFNPDKISASERNFKGNKTPTFIHMVTIPEWGNDVKPLEKEFSLSPTWARDVRRQMLETGNTYFKVRREGSSADQTKYIFTPL